MKPVIHSEKHILQKSLSTVAAGAIDITTLASAVDIPGMSNEVVAVGAVIKALNIEMWVRANDAVAGSFVFAVIKLPSGQSVPTAANMANLNDYGNKNNVFWISMGLSNDKLSDAMHVAPGLVLIPKGKQRMSLGDKWITVLFAQALDHNSCGKTIYKEYL